jgi:carbon-monoxide dehydrogenase small subunit
VNEEVEIRVTVNGSHFRHRVPARLLLVDYIREVCGLLGTQAGCEQGVCGSCTVIVDGMAVRSCLVLAAQSDGEDIRTVEGLASEGLASEGLSTLQRSFQEHHALQCGFCIPGILMTAQTLLDSDTELTDERIRDAVSGHTCRCTGYEPIVDAIRAAAQAEAKGPEAML